MPKYTGAGHYDYYTTPTHSTVAVNSAAVQVAAANQSRTYALFINDSSNDIYLMFGASASVNAGVLIGPSGGNYEMSGAFGNLYNGLVTAIAGSDGNNLLVLEGSGK